MYTYISSPTTTTTRRRWGAKMGSGGGHLMFRGLFGSHICVLPVVEQFSYFGDLPRSLVTARFFATVACLTLSAALVANGLVIFVLPTQPQAERAWWSARILYGVTLFGTLMTFTIFSNCDDYTPCDSGPGAAVNGCNVVILIGLIVLVFWLDVPEQGPLLTGLYDRILVVISAAMTTTTPTTATTSSTTTSPAPSHHDNNKPAGGEIEAPTAAASSMAQHEGVDDSEPEQLYDNSSTHTEAVTLK
jgi:hypothetical protein